MVVIILVFNIIRSPQKQYKKKSKTTKFRKSDTKLFLFEEYMIVFVENPWIIYRDIIKTFGEISRVAGLKTKH